ncbi:hypothetical protein [Prochlorothrix hollandica]|uniref:hypothetical protein n=1 Tax=Prochlorothrix hollandica TaxID=1223 RepID=UPI0012B651F5|nr:hypothetical protein [Prochlorothrix hollandica]
MIHHHRHQIQQLPDALATAVEPFLPQRRLLPLRSLPQMPSLALLRPPSLKPLAVGALGLGLGVELWLWDWQLTLAGSVGLGVMFLADRLRHLGRNPWLWHWPQRLSPPQQFLILAVTSGGVAAINTYWLAVVWTETGSPGLTLGLVLQSGGLLGGLGVLVYHWFRTQVPSLDSPSLDSPSLDPLGTADGFTLSKVQPKVQRRDNGLELALTAALKRAEDPHPLGRLAAIHRLGQLRQDPTVTPAQDQLIQGGLRWLGTQDRDALVREAALEQLAIDPPPIGQPQTGQPQTRQRSSGQRHRGSDLSNHHRPEQRQGSGQVPRGNQGWDDRPRPLNSDRGPDRGPDRGSPDRPPARTQAQPQPSPLQPLEPPTAIAPSPELELVPCPVTLAPAILESTWSDAPE